MNYRIILPVVCTSVLLLSSCESVAPGNKVTSTGSTVAVQASKEPNELRLSVPESPLKFNNLFYGEPLRLETEKTKCRKGMESKLCSTPFKLYHIGDVSEFHLPLLQILLLDTSMKDTSSKSYVDFVSALIQGEKKDLEKSSDILAKFNDEKVIEVVAPKRGSIDNKDFASYYSVAEKNKKQLLYYTVAKKINNSLLVVRLGAGLNQEANKESFSSFAGCGKNCTVKEKATSYIAKKEAFAGYTTLVEKVQKMLVSFE